MSIIITILIIDVHTHNNSSNNNDAHDNVDNDNDNLRAASPRRARHEFMWAQQRCGGRGKNAGSICADLGVLNI